MDAELSETKSVLQQEKRRIDQAIKDYPTPIAACDAQFNFLLAERGRITEQLVELEARHTNRSEHRSAK